MADAAKTELIYTILFTLPTSSISTLSKQLIPFIHIDPAYKLPAELVVQTLTYLSVSQIIAAATLSKTWNFQAMQPGLWRRKFMTCGWNWNRIEVRKFENEIARVTEDLLVNSNPHPSSGAPRRQSSKRRRIHAQSAARERKNSILSEGPDQHNVEMPDASDDAWLHGSMNFQPVQSFGSTGSNESSTSMALDAPESPLGTRFHHRTASALDPARTRATGNLIASAAYGTNRINWYHLFKQRQRLENNWRTARYKNFQLPHACHPEEAHEECVYALQFAGNLLVSGSRDKSIRIWNLDTQRLVQGPLIAHKGSVLCLQFDASPEEDVLISGSSDYSVVVWKLSTGTVTKKILRAHEDSVLNLRFNKEILVTCSKDKTIRIWNRMYLHQTDNSNRFFPLVGTSATTDPIIVPRLGEKRCVLETLSPAMQLDLSSLPPSFSPRPVLPPYSLIRVLDGHVAAINAVQIFEGQIVSASGDRNMKKWDWKTGRALRTTTGHRNGIACIQYDGRRIITGSNDNSIRIFDAMTGAQVSELGGHASLVRTIQCSFGDTLGSSLDDFEEATASDAKNWEAQFESAHQTRKGRLRSIDDIKAMPMAIGALLPPGGGGSINAKIVSGSYDEKVAIWRRDRNGQWTMSTVLRADEALESATVTQLQDAYNQGFSIKRGYPIYSDLPAPPPAPAPAAGPYANGPALTGGVPAVRTPLPQYKIEMPPDGMGDGLPPHQSSVSHAGNSDSELPPALLQYLQAQNPPPLPEPQTAGIRWRDVNPVSGSGPATTQTIFPPNFVPWTGADGHVFGLPSGVPQPHVQPENRPPRDGGAVGDGWAGRVPNLLPPMPNRVFKLQFDARMIVACTQDCRIVGWDFARGDREILEACRFFSA